MKYLLKDGKVERSRREKEERKREREKIVDAMRGERRSLMS